MRRSSIVVVLVLVSGCVPMKKYRTLETDLKDTQSTLIERDQQLKDRDAEIARQQSEIKDLQDRSAELGKQADDLRRQIDEAQTKEASLLADKGKLASNIEAMKTALKELEARKEAAEESVKAFRDLLNRFKKLIDAGKLRVRIVEGRMVVELATDVLFTPGSADLSKDGRAAIVEVAGVLASIKDREFQVAGHTDSVPIKNEKYASNWELAAARALNVVKTMVDAGMPPKRISAASYAEFKPAAKNDTPAGKAANRRIEITIVPDLSDLPGYNELNAAAKGQ
jgi:chemotaxis protein MotB